MGEFKRSPSRVWWASESLEWQEVSSDSPGSQDSGFSDSETSPQINQHNQEPTVQERISKNVSPESPRNISTNYKEKSTPEKSKLQQLHTPSPKQFRFTKNSPKVSRNLFRNGKNNKSGDDIKESTNQYSQNAERSPATGGEVTPTRRSRCAAGLSNKSQPILGGVKNNKDFFNLNKTDPGCLVDLSDELESSCNSNNGNHSLSSDCESELECLFLNNLESPKHTSTPKSFNPMNRPRGDHKIPLNLFLKYQSQRVPPLTPEAVDNEAVKMWMTEVKKHLEAECMTTLQSKSIAAELEQQVASKASTITATIRNILSCSKCIQMEYKKLNGEKKHIGPLAQSLAGNVIDFLTTYSDLDPKLQRQYDDIRKSKDVDQTLAQVLDLFNHWQMVNQDVLIGEVKRLIERIERPTGELDFRASVTGLTSLCLRNEDLIDLFAKHDIIPVLLIFCEKCDGSSIRSLLLRCLSTICCSAFAVRQFEKFFGIQIVADILAEHSRPEPERSEAVALLAQVTAPWIEDNHCIRGLADYSKSLVKSLTRFIPNTKCCQNLLLCTAALANLTTMDAKCIKFVLHMDSVKVLLDAVGQRGPCASVYLLEQVATLVANMSAWENARKELCKIKVAPALLNFLKANHCNNEDVIKRLQQKSIIALSRLCTEYEAANQVVEAGGVDKLVKLCREKSERFDSDAVLVATLATLRKISESCGRDVIRAEDAQELVEPKLLDSFLAYSTQSESYV